MNIRILLAALVAVMVTLPAAAQDRFLGSYVARLSDNDHFASDGYRLDTAAQVVRQDRANFHRFGTGDFEDEDDGWFRTANARARMEQMLNRSGAMTQATRRAIMGGEPIVQVDVYRNSMRVSIIGY